MSYVQENRNTVIIDILIPAPNLRDLSLFFVLLDEDFVYAD